MAQPGGTIISPEISTCLTKIQQAIQELSKKDYKKATTIFNEANALIKQNNLTNDPEIKKSIETYLKNFLGSVCKLRAQVHDFGQNDQIPTLNKVEQDFFAQCTDQNQPNLIIQYLDFCPNYYTTPEDVTHLEQQVSLVCQKFPSNSALIDSRTKIRERLDFVRSGMQEFSSSTLQAAKAGKLGQLDKLTLDKNLQFINKKAGEEAKTTETVESLIAKIKEKGMPYATKILAPVENQRLIAELEVFVNQALNLPTFEQASKINENYKKLFGVCLDINQWDILHNILIACLRKKSNEVLVWLLQEVNKRNPFSSNIRAKKLADIIKKVLDKTNESSVTKSKDGTYPASIAGVHNTQEAKSHVVKNPQSSSLNVASADDKSTENKDVTATIEKIKSQLDRLIVQTKGLSLRPLNGLRSFEEALQGIETLGFNFQIRNKASDYLVIFSSLPPKQSNDLLIYLCNLPSGMTSLFLEHAKLLGQAQQQAAVIKLIEEMDIAAKIDKEDKIDFLFEKLMFLKEVQVVILKNQFKGATKCLDQLRNWIDQNKDIFLKLQDLFFDKFSKPISDNELRLMTQCILYYHPNFSTIEEVRYIQEKLRAAVTANVKTNPKVGNFAEQMLPRLKMVEDALSSHESRKSNDLEVRGGARQVTGKSNNEMALKEKTIMDFLEQATEAGINTAIQLFVDYPNKNELFIATFTSTVQSYVDIGLTSAEKLQRLNKTITPGSAEVKFTPPQPNPSTDVKDGGVTHESKAVDAKNNNLQKKPFELPLASKESIDSIKRLSNLMSQQDLNKLSIYLLDKYLSQAIDEYYEVPEFDQNEKLFRQQLFLVLTSLNKARFIQPDELDAYLELLDPNNELDIAVLSDIYGKILSNDNSTGLIKQIKSFCITNRVSLPALPKISFAGILPPTNTPDAKNDKPMKVAKQIIIDSLKEGLFLADDDIRYIEGQQPGLYLDACQEVSILLANNTLAMKYPSAFKQHGVALNEILASLRPMNQTLIASVSSKTTQDSQPQISTHPVGGPGMSATLANLGTTSSASPLAASPSGETVIVPVPANLNNSTLQSPKL